MCHLNQIPRQYLPLSISQKPFLKPGDALTVDEFNEKLKDLKQASVS